MKRIRLALLGLGMMAIIGAMAASLATAESPGGGKAVIGQLAPAFSLQNQDGKIVNLADDSGKIVVLEWTNPNCPFVVRHYREKTMLNLDAQYQDKGVNWIAINSTKSADNTFNKQWREAQSIPYPILNDSAGQVAREYTSKNTPTMYIIGKDGKLLYRGAIDNDPEDDKGTAKINYVKQALDEILAGKPVSAPETKAYGCTVHY